MVERSNLHSADFAETAGQLEGGEVAACFANIPFSHYFTKLLKFFQQHYFGPSVKKVKTFSLENLSFPDVIHVNLKK